MSVQLKPLTLDESEVFRKLLGSSEFGGCFCAVWSGYGDDWAKRCGDPAQPNFQTTLGHLKQGRHIGFLAYSEGDLIGWTGAGPKTSFPIMETKMGSRLSDFTDEIWSVGCLAVSKDYRGLGFSEKIVRAIQNLARERGALFIEGYPVRPYDEPRIYRGTYDLFDRLGFSEFGAEKDEEFEVLCMRYNIEDQT